MSDKLTEDEAEMLNYFWQQKGDITRWASADWDQINSRAPQLMRLWNAYVDAKSNLDRYMEKLP